MVNALLSSLGSNTATIKRNAAGISVAPAIPEMARRTKNEYMSGRKEMTILRIPRARKPKEKTGFAEYCQVSHGTIDKREYAETYQVGHTTPEK